MVRSGSQSPKINHVPSGAFLQTCPTKENPDISADVAEVEQINSLSALHYLCRLHQGLKKLHVPG